MCFGSSSSVSRSPRVLSTPQPPTPPDPNYAAAQAARQERLKAAARYGLTQTRTAGLGAPPLNTGTTLLGS